MGAAQSPSANDVLAKARPEDRVATPAALVRLRPLISAGLRNAVGRMSPRLSRIVSYHLGWQDQIGRDTDADGGKALRPTIALVAAESVGAAAEAALPGAVAAELVHNFSLIHDDVIDRDRERRHRPTVWALFGAGEAIIAGDALLALAQRILLEDAPPQARRAAEDLNRATVEMIEGQAEDLSFESRVEVSVEECLSMSARKTAGLLSAAAAIGAILGGADEQRIQTLGTFGRHLGLAFQAVDDVLGLWGDPMTTGKPAASDLRQRKKTIPVAHALSSPGGGELRALLSNEELDDGAVGRALQIVEQSGSRDWALEVAGHNLTAALDALEEGSLVPVAADELRELARFVVWRDF